MHKAIPMILVTILAVLVTGCGGDDGAAPDFATADLKRLSFAPDELRGLEYQRESSGRGALTRDQEGEAGEAEEGDQSGLELLARLRRLGLEAEYVSQFFATDRGADHNFVESIIFLFEDAAAADEAVDALKDGAAANLESAEEIEAPDLGQQPFGIRGKFDGFPTYAFGWRAGDVIGLVTVAPADRKAGSESTIELAERLAARAES